MVLDLNGDHDMWYFWEEHNDKIWIGINLCHFYELKAETWEGVYTMVLEHVATGRDSHGIIVIFLNFYHGSVVLSIQMNIVIW